MTPKETKSVEYCTGINEAGKPVLRKPILMQIGVDAGNFKNGQNLVVGVDCPFLQDGACVVRRTNSSAPDCKILSPEGSRQPLTPQERTVLQSTILGMDTAATSVQASIHEQDVEPT